MLYSRVIAAIHGRINRSRLVVNDKLVKILPQHTEIEQNRERLVAKIQHC